MTNSVSYNKEQDNRRIYERNIPSAMLQPYLDVRPVMTKYSYFPIVDPRRQLNTKLIERPTYNVNATFNPGNTVSPWSGFASNINTETMLRNQIYALQDCSQSVYVPSSNSDLYVNMFQPQNTGTPGAHSLLFKNEQFGDFNPNPDKNVLGTNLFMNSTRSQIKDLITDDEI